MKFLVVLLLSFLLIQNTFAQQRVYGAIQGLNAQLLQKLNELATQVFNSRIRVYSGCRSGNPPDQCHAACSAADFTVEGRNDLNTFQTLKNNVNRLRNHLLIYHVPGQRRCSTGEHLHLCNRSQRTVFCHEKRCIFDETECQILSKNSTDTEHFFEPGIGPWKGHFIDGFLIPNETKSN